MDNSDRTVVKIKVTDMKASTYWLIFGLSFVCGFLLMQCANAEGLQFQFSGYTLTPDYQNVQPLVVSFIVDTLAPSNRMSYTTTGCSYGACVDTITAGLVATGLNVSLGGQMLESNGPGVFAFNGGLFGPPGQHGAFIGGTFGASGGTNGFVGIPDFSLGEARQSQLLAATDPLAAVLDGAGFITDGITLFYDNGTYTPAWVGGTVTQVSVPEPGIFGLMALGLLAIVAGRRLLEFFAGAAHGD